MRTRLGGHGVVGRWTRVAAAHKSCRCNKTIVGPVGQLPVAAAAGTSEIPEIAPEY